MVAGGIVAGAPALSTLVISAVPCTQFAQPSTFDGPNLTATAGDSQVVLNWTVAAPAHGYIVCEAASSDYTKSVEVETSTALSATVNSLTNGTAYYFWIVDNGKFVGGPPVSNVASAIPMTTPGSPTSLTVTPHQAQAALSWTAPASDGGSKITSYRVYDGNTADFTDGTPAATATDTSATVTGLTAGTHYFRVTAVNAAGEGVPSEEESATFAPNTVPGQPAGLTATASGSGVVLSWTAPASDGGAAITGYVIDEGTSPDLEPGTPVNGSPVKATSDTVTGLTKGSTYYFTVAAVNAVGQGPASGKVSATLPAATSPASPAFAAPNGLTATAGNAQVHLSWTAPASDGGSRVTGYDLYRTTAPGFQASAVITSVTGTSTTVTGLTNGTTYYFMVAAINATGHEGPFSAEVPAKPGTTTTVTLTSAPVPKQLIVVLAAIATVALAGAFTLANRGRRPDSRSPRHVTPRSDVRAEPGPRQPGAVNVRDTGNEPTHTVRFEPDHGITTTTIKEKS